MKIQPGAGAPTQGATVGGLRWTVTPSGTVIAAKPVNNLRSQSTNFQSTNWVIIQIDAQFDALAP
jgi:hypothetical protein